METKIHLSQDELKLMRNSAWILTKNRVIDKVCSGLGRLATEMQLQVQSNGHLFPGKILLFSPKVSKGEKYEGLPYVMLDYPRLFEKEHVLAIRSFFWWGHFCTSTLHVKGQYMLPVIEKMREGFCAPPGKAVYLSVSGNEWNHDVTTADYQLFSDLGRADFIKKAETAAFMKLSLKTEISEWEVMEKEWRLSFNALIELAQI